MAHSSKKIKESLEHKHPDEMHLQGSYLGPAVYGAIDGTVTTFAVVSGVVGANLSPGIILILGFANLLADGFSMASGEYLSSKSEIDYMKQEYERERWETENFPAGEKEEIRQIYKKKGFSGKDLERAVEIITSNQKRWVETMMVEELGLQMEHKNPIRSAFITFCSFIIAGLMPLITYIIAYIRPEIISISFTITSILTAITLFTAGALRTFLTGKNWILNGVEMLLVGGLAATVAYGIGYILSFLA